MAKIFNLPDLGEGLPDAKIVAWYVKVGDEVTLDQLLVSVETAKAVVDIPAPRAGIIEKLCAAPGEILTTGKPLVIFVAEDNILESNPKSEQTIVGNLQIKEDLEVTDKDWETIDYTTRAMALSMQKSAKEVVPSVIFEDLILAEPINIDLTVNLMQAIVSASYKEPTLNAWFKQEFNNFKVKMFKEVNLGIAVDSTDGLFVPVIKNIVSKNSIELRQELDLLKQQIATRTIELDKMQHPSFILSNFGKFAGRYAVPVILPPTVAVLAVGRIRQKFMIVGGVNTVKNCLPLSLAFDHRLVTGGQAARFLRAILEFFV